MRLAPWLALALIFGACTEEEDRAGDFEPGGGTPVVQPAQGFSKAPKIPEVRGQCPPLRSGVTTINGLSTNIYAGNPVPGRKGPLLFYWHGTAGRGSMAEWDLPRQVRDEILAEGGMIVAPTDAGANREGADVTFLLGVWFTPGDLILADQVVACAVRDHNIDPRRIYTTGASAGGLMSGVMALNRSSYVAASVPNSGGIAVPLPPLNTIEDRSHIPPVMSLHGDPQRDTVIISFADSSRTLNQIVTRAGGFAINCQHGGGHAFPPTDLKLASWQFMKDHPFGVDPEPYARGLPASFPDYCEIFGN